MISCGSVLRAPVGMHVGIEADADGGEGGDGEGDAEGPEAHGAAALRWGGAAPRQPEHHRRQQRRGGGRVQCTHTTTGTTLRREAGRQPAKMRAAGFRTVTGKPGGKPPGFGGHNDKRRGGKHFMIETSVCGGG